MEDLLKILCEIPTVTIVRVSLFKLIYHIPMKYDIYAKYNNIDDPKYLKSYSTDLWIVTNHLLMRQNTSR